MSLPKAFPLLILLTAVHVPAAIADDWPQWRGSQRDGVWREDGILDKFPEGGLEATWRVPIGRGYTGPSVARGRVFVSEFEPADRNTGRERLICFDEETGERIWEHDWPADYTGLQYSLGPRATPTVDGDTVFTLGAAGDLVAVRFDDGKPLWHVNFRRDYDAPMPTWGFSGAPLVVGNRVIVLAGGHPDAKVLAFNRETGKELWRSLPPLNEPGYASPMLYTAADTPQVIIWHAHGVASLQPETGEVYWEHPFELNYGMSVATPVFDDGRLLVSAFYNGARLYQLSDDAPEAKLVWKGNSDSEIQTDTLHAVVTTPVIDGDYIYGVGSYGQLRCLDAKTGERIWETMDLTVEKARWASAQIVRHGGRYFINNDRGELIIARLTPDGYQEIDRTELIKPTNPKIPRREREAVNWVHPAYANRHLITRNDEELIRVSLAAE